MKKLLILAVAAFGFTSCEKQYVEPEAPVAAVPIPTITMTKSASSVDLAVVPPKSFYTVAEFDFTITGNTTGSVVEFVPTITIGPADPTVEIDFKQLKNLYVTVDNGASLKYTPNATVAFKDTSSLETNGVHKLKIMYESIAVMRQAIVHSLEMQYKVKSSLNGKVLKKGTTGTIAGPTLSFDDRNIYTAAFPSVAKVAIPSALSANGTAMKAYAHTVTAINGAVAVKQFAYGIAIADNGVQGTLELGTLKFLENGVDITSKVAFSNAAGTALTKLGETDTKVFVTYSIGESRIEKDAKTLYELVVTPSGMSDGDGFSAGLLGDNSAPYSGYRYVNKGTVGVHAKLAPTKTASDNSDVYHFIWSNLSSESHSGVFGLSSDDWFNGYKILSGLSTNTFTN